MNPQLTLAMNRMVEIEKEKRELEERIDSAIEKLQNVRNYSAIYTPIKEGCDHVLRILKGRE